MKIVLAFDSLKGCLSAREACEAAGKALHEILPNAEVIPVPLSDGGEGLMESVEQILPTHRIALVAHGPLKQDLKAEYLLSEDGKTAYMEMAATCGLPLVPESSRNPLLTTTYGVGDMIGDAIRRGAGHIVMGIGGSATCDGGMGMVQSLREQGLKCYPRITVASDVTNPLLGLQGAARVFGPQKGATPTQVELLEKRLSQWTKKTEEAGIATPDLANYPGAGAAGGLGYGLMAYLGAELKSGIEIILGITHFDEIIKDADIVITGEGKSDEQTLMGKVPDGVLRHCKQQGVPVWLMSGMIEDSNGALAQSFDHVISINENDNRTLSELIKPEVAKENLRKTLISLFRTDNP